MKYLGLILASCVLVGVAIAAPIPTVSSHATPALVSEVNTAIADIQTKIGTNGISAASFATNVAVQTAAVAGTVTLQTVSLTNIVGDVTNVFLIPTNVAVSTAGVTTNVLVQKSAIR